MKYTLWLLCFTCQLWAHNPMTGTFQVGEAKLAFTVAGSGEPLMVLPNSWGVSQTALRTLFKDLEQHFQVIYFDPRGMGASSPLVDPSDCLAATARSDMNALRQHLKLDKVFVLGWSAGAMSALYYAAENTDHVRGTIFVHGISHTNPEELAELVAAHKDFYQRRNQMIGKVMQMTSGQDVALKRYVVDEWFPYLCADREAGKKLMKDVFEPMNFSWAHMLGLFGEFDKFDARDQLSNISAPALLIAGEQDQILPKAIERDAKAMPKGTYVAFANSGHFAMLEEPEAFVKAIQTWRAKHMPAKTASPN